MATKCYTDAEIAAIIAAASGGPTLLDTQLLGATVSPRVLTDEELARLEEFSGSPGREADTTPYPGLSSGLVAVSGPVARVASPTLTAVNGRGVATRYETLTERYPFLDPYYREKYGSPTGSQPPTLGLPSGPTTPLAPTVPQRPATPTTTNTQAGAPDTIFEPGQPVGGNMDNFSCPTNSAGCLEAIPRTDAVDLYSEIFDPGKTSGEIAINLDDARGMLMQDICAMINVVVNAAVTPPPTSVEQAQFYQQLFFLGHWTLRFRDTDVPGFKNRPLSDIAEKPGCCDDPCARVGCTVPEYGGMGIEFDFVDIPAWVDRVELLLRVNFTGCPTDKNGGCGCGCGGNSRVDNPYIRVGALT